jgi:hypothetical protein
MNYFEEDFSGQLRALLIMNDDGVSRDDMTQWPDYAAIGFNHSHTDELVKMATHEGLFDLDEDCSESWAASHALQALVQLSCVEAIHPLFTFIDQNDSDWPGEKIPFHLAKMGEPAIENLRLVMADETIGWYGRMCACGSLAKIGTRDPELRLKCIDVITNQLRHHEGTNRGLNGGFVNYLLDLEATESIELIREAFDANSVDYSAAGDIQDVERVLGLREDRTKPRPDQYEKDFRHSPLTSPAQPLKHSEKVKRNDPCPCGSGKKYKRCCG